MCQDNGKESESESKLQKYSSYLLEQCQRESVKGKLIFELWNKLVQKHNPIQIKSLSLKKKTLSCTLDNIMYCIEWPYFVFLFTVMHVLFVNGTVA